MTALLGLIGSAWPTILLGLAAVAAAVVALFKHQEVKTVTAEKDTATATAQAATREASSARAEADALQKALAVAQTAVASRAQVEADTAELAKTPGAAQQALNTEGFTEK